MKQSQRSPAHPRVSPHRKPRSQPNRKPAPGTGNAYDASNLSTLRIAEDSSDGYVANPRLPDARPQILVLEERHHSLYAASRLLKSSGYTVRTIFEEGHAVASIVAAENTHFLLLTVHDTTRPICVPRLIERLRQLYYNKSITCCLKGKVSAEMRAAYEALSVDRVLALPVTAPCTALDALHWVSGQIMPGQGGLTILEV